MTLDFCALRPPAYTLAYYRGLRSGTALQLILVVLHPGGKKDVRPHVPGVCHLRS